LRTDQENPCGVARIQAAIARVGLAFASLAQATTVLDDPSDIRQALFPSDRYTALDPNQLTGLRVRLTKVSFC
jgi:hypothetical protein